MKLLFEKDVPGSNAFRFPMDDLPPAAENIPHDQLRSAPVDLPELSEVEAVRHFVELSHRAFGVDDGTYALGSCTMKYSPKVNQWAAQLPGFADIHPNCVQPGADHLMCELQEMLADLTGMDAFTLQPAAGAHGELTGMMIIHAYLRDQGQNDRKVVLIPDSAHGTNPASAVMAGFTVRVVKSGPDGLVDLDDLAAKCGPDVAGLMLTNPNTLGLFEKNILEISRLVHDCGGLLYYDGANLNAIVGVARPGDMGFDVVHVNLHKTFSTPHGGGGPGAGPVGVKEFLRPYLPYPTIRRGDDGQIVFDADEEKSIGKVKSFFGNFGVCLKAYAYIKSVGYEGLKNAAQLAVLNANYLRCRLSEYFDIPFNTLCKHEFVASNLRQAPSGVRTLDIAKRLIDFKYHPPTIYFPMIVHEAMMFEPTETESKSRLDALAEAMKQIAREAETTPELVQGAPHNTVIGRPDETKAARNPVLSYKKPAQ